MKPILIGLLAALLTTSALTLSLTQNNNPAPTASLSVGHGDVDTLKAAFSAWREIYEKQGGSPETLKLTLGYSKGLSDSFTQARGKLSFNLLDGQLSFQATGLSEGAYDLWFVADGAEPGNTVRPEATDKLLRVGSLDVSGGKAKLSTQLSQAQLAGFSLDTVVVTQAGKSPIDSIVITGSPDLMQKLYYANQPWAMAELADYKGSAPKQEAPFAFLLPKLAVADTLTDLTPVLGAQVALGRQLFHNETFNGNGRTCGTCHRADNNFTIDPNYIATLPANDPLFVAETNPALANLENPTLLRKFGLILTNVDGPGTDIFRSVPHTLSLATTIVSERQNPATPFKKGEFAADEAFANATGWSGDGAPGSGSLREFATGAVIQHLPKTLARNTNPNDAIPDDFRLPTGAELDAIEAYTLSLGRSKDYPVFKLTFLDPLTQAGKVLFDTKQNGCSGGGSQAGGPSPAAACPNGQTVVQGATANCNGCHTHAGGRSSTTFANPTRNTGVENFKIHPARLSKPDLAFDGGFGTEASVCGPNGATCFGDGRFNTTPLIEAADTAPFFHNNSVTTLEEAIASYNSDAFNNSPGALTAKLADRKVKLDSTQVVAVASFLRAINVLENIRLSNHLDNQARQVANNATARELAKLASEENQDAIRVLKEGTLGVFNAAVTKLSQAAYFQNLALTAPAQATRNVLLQQAITAKKQAKALIATCNENEPVPSDVVVSPAGFTYSCAEFSTF